MFKSLAGAALRYGPIRWIGALSMFMCLGLSVSQAQVCDAEGGMLSIDPDGVTSLVICADDGIPDPFTVNVSGAEGQNQIFLVTDNYGNILANSTSPNFDFEGTGEGGCFIFNLAYSDGFEGDFAPGGNFCMFNPSDGCFDLSSYVLVIRRTGEDCTEPCEEEGGDLTIDGTEGETAIVICADDGESDAFDVVLENNVSTNSDYLVTDLDGNILSFPAAPPFDLDGAGVGICLVWHISYDDEVTGLVEGGNAEDIDGCFSLSNFIQVTRYVAEAGEISLEGGGTDTTICVDDLGDPLDVIGTDNTQGEEFTFVITDSEGNILDLPEGNGPFDLNGAGPGTCLIWYLAYNPDIEGLEVGANAFDLSGCFDLSNAITVERNLPDAGEIEFENGGTDTTICLDGSENPLNVTQLSDSTMGGNFTFVITDAEGNILDIPAGNGPFDLSGAGDGTCLIWYLAFEDGLEGAEVGLNAGDLEGCFDLSNPLTVNRNAVDGGTITFADSTGMMTGDTVTICAGDEIPDPLDVIQTGDPQGSNFTFVITDAEGNILDIPAGNGPFDLEGAGGGTCLIWYLAFEDGLEGAEVGLNAGDLEGCFDLSNPLTVVRLEGDECDNDVCDLPDVPDLFFANESDSICVDSIQQLADLSFLVNGDLPDDNWALFLLENDENGDALNLAETTLGPVDFSMEGVAFDSNFTFPLAGFYESLTVVLVIYDEDTNPYGILNRGCDEPCRLPVDSLSDCFVRSNPLTIQIGCGEECEAEAGTLNPVGDTELCLTNDGVLLVAETGEAPVVPEGFTVLYLLTSGDELLGEDSGDEPEFFVDEPGTYTIHTLVIDTVTIDTLSADIETGFDLFELTIDGGGDLCASLLVQGAQFTVVECDGPGILDPEFQQICLEDQLGGPAVVSLIDSAEYEGQTFDLIAVNAVTGEIIQIESDGATIVIVTTNAAIYDVYAIFYDPANIFGLVEGGNIDDLGGDFALSVSSRVLVGNATNGCLDAYNTCGTEAGVVIPSDPDAEFCFCVEDGVPDFFNVELESTGGVVGDTSLFVLTLGDTVVAIADEDGQFNFEGLPPGEFYTIRHIALSNGTIEVGDILSQLPASTCYSTFGFGNLEGIFLLSNEDCGEGILINEVTADGTVELFNSSSVKSVNAGQFRLSNVSNMATIGDLAIECGELFLRPGEYVSVRTNWNAGDNGELILYLDEGAVEFIDYVQWGEGPHTYEQMAIDAGQWQAGEEVDAPTVAQSLQYFPEDDKVWRLGEETLCGINSSPLSIGQLDGPGSLLVYPNPATDRLIIETSEFIGQTGFLELNDLTGRSILVRDLDQLNGRLELSLPQLPAGTYLLRVSSEQAIRLVKLHVRQ